MSARGPVAIGALASDVAPYERHAADWWEADAAHFRSLRAVKAHVLDLLDEAWGAALDSARVVDLGCGGGLLALPLAERGARVTGVDLSGASVARARAEAERRGLAARFVHADLERTPLAAESADFVVLSDVVEHIPHPDAALAEAARLLCPGGGLFVNTFDRTLLAQLVVVHLAETLRLVPPGTHDARRFVRPAELVELGRRVGLEAGDVRWERPDLLRTLRTWTVHLRRARRGVAYSVLFVKEGR